MKIEIAYDRKNERYVAYNLEANIIATGICVESTVEKFKEKRLQKIAESEEIHRKEK